jgi:hypothetical protein
MYYEAFAQMKKTLGQIDKWLEAAAAYADSRKFDGNVLLQARLAPDQFAFARQVQTACDTARLGAARLCGKEAEKYADDETTLDALRARVQGVVANLDGYSASDFDGAATRQVTTPRWEGKHMLGADYFLEHVLANFYFHAAHAYAMLRHNGVPLGKRDYLGPLSMRSP